MSFFKGLAQGAGQGLQINNQRQQLGLQRQALEHKQQLAKKKAFDDLIGQNQEYLGQLAQIAITAKKNGQPVPKEVMEAGQTLVQQLDMLGQRQGMPAMGAAMWQGALSTVSDAYMDEQEQLNQVGIDAKVIDKQKELGLAPVETALPNGQIRIDQKGQPPQIIGSREPIVNVMVDGKPTPMRRGDALTKGLPFFSSVSQADTPEAALGLGKDEVKALRDAEIAALNFMGTAKDALNLLSESPDINTWLARGASMVNDLQREAIAIANQFDIQFDDGALDPSSHDAAFDRLGIDNARMRGIITSLAFQAAAASGQTGRSVSNRDIERFIGEIGASSSDPRAFAATLVDVTNRVERGFLNNYEVRLKEKYNGNLGKPEMPEFRPTADEALSGEAGANLAPEGTRVQMEDGSIMVKRNGEWVKE